MCSRKLVGPKLKHMSSIRFSNVDKISNEDEEPVRLCNYVDVTTMISLQALDFMVATATTTEIRAFQLRKGDVLITKDSGVLGRYRGSRVCGRAVR